MSIISVSESLGRVLVESGLPLTEAPTAIGSADLASHSPPTVRGM